MVKINLDHEKYKFTSKNVVELFNIDETILPTKDVNLYFNFKEDNPYLVVGDKEYAFESNGGFMFFLQKLYLNSKLITTLSNQTLANVVNELLYKNSLNLNLVIDKNTNKILTGTYTSSNLINWRKIIKVVSDVFANLEEKDIYITTNTGLSISIVIANIDSELDVVWVEPQMASSIAIHRGFTRRLVSLKGYDENEVLEDLKKNLEEILADSPALVKG